MSAPTEGEIAAVLMALAARRGRGASFCPSEAARALAADWRPLMAEVRRVSGGLAEAGALEATQRGRPVRLAEARGPVRLRLGPVGDPGGV